jgi:predicted nuclease of predicted toxin-antitoxin system
MRILLDENLDWRLKRHLPGHEVDSVPLLSCSGIQNGDLLRKPAENGFNVLITMDSNMVYQQNIPVQSISLIVLRAQSNRLADTSVLMHAVLQALPDLQKGTVKVIG